jgi:hypothetical protein
VSETGRYLYAVARGLDPAALHGVEALAGGVLDVVEHHGLSAVVSTVDLEEYGEEGLRANLERLDWLEHAARTHDAVVKAVADHAPVAPMRLATIFLDDDSVRRRLDEWFLALEQVLDRVEGRSEWSVKLISPAAGTAEPAAAASRPVSGADYLRQKKEQGAGKAAREAESQQLAERVHEMLSARSVASRRLPPQDPRLTGHQGTMVLNAAYLVEAEMGDAFAEEARACGAQHPQVQLDVRGPWPPYSFAMREQR